MSLVMNMLLHKEVVEACALQGIRLCIGLLAACGFMMVAQQQADAQLVIPREVPAARSAQPAPKAEPVPKPRTKPQPKVETVPPSRAPAADREMEAYSGPPQQGQSRLQLPRDLRLAASYSECSEFTYELSHYPDVVYVWRINGTEVLRGKGKSSFSYTMGPPGDLEIRVSLEGSDGREYSTSKGHTKVTGVVPLPYRIKAGLTGNFDNMLPAGYKKYSWFIDTAEIAANRSLQHCFKSPGTYMLEGIAWEPERDGLRAYSRVLYEVTVY